MSKRRMIRPQWHRVSASRVPRKARRPEIIHLDCPKCGARLDNPFSRISGPVPHVHRFQGGTERPAPGCRLMIWPDPAQEDNHRAWVLPENVSLEAAIRVTARLYPDAIPGAAGRPPPREWVPPWERGE